MRYIYFFLFIVAITSCSKKFQEINSFGSGKSFSKPLQQNQEKVFLNNENTKETLGKFQEQTQNLDNTINNNKLSIHKKKKSAVFKLLNKPKKSYLKTTIKNHLNELKSSKFGFVIKKKYPLYTNILFILGYLSFIVALLVLFQNGFSDAISTLTYGGHGDIVEFLAWTVLGFLQFLFGNWMKRLVNNDALGKGSVAILHLILTFIFGGVAIILGMV